MKLSEAMARLEAMGTEQNRKIYRRHGAKGELFGVSFANLKLLVKEIKKDHALAIALWKTGNVDARTLATMIADPAAFSSDELELWLGELSYYLLVDLFASLVAKGPHAKEKAEAWSASEDEWRARAGFDLVTRLAMDDASLSDAWFEEKLDEIRRRIHAAPNRTRDAMNSALIAIGGSRESLRDKAIAAARAIGKVEVDHGETGCKTPDAEQYILKMVSHRAKKKPTSKKKSGARSRA